MFQKCETRLDLDARLGKCPNATMSNLTLRASYVEDIWLGDCMVDLQAGRQAKIVSVLVRWLAS